MKRRVVVRGAAARDVEHAYSSYEGQPAGPGDKFVRDLRRVHARLSRHPETGGLVALRTRTALLSRFPYFVLYTVEPDHILVTAVFHNRRNPRRWSDRVREGVVTSGWTPGEFISA